MEPGIVHLVIYPEGHFQMPIFFFYFIISESSSPCTGLKCTTLVRVETAARMEGASETFL